MTIETLPPPETEPGTPQDPGDNSDPLRNIPPEVLMALRLGYPSHVASLIPDFRPDKIPHIDPEMDTPILPRLGPTPGDPSLFNHVIARRKREANLTDPFGDFSQHVLDIVDGKRGLNNAESFRACLNPNAKLPKELQARYDNGSLDLADALSVIQTKGLGSLEVGRFTQIDNDPTSIIDLYSLMLRQISEIDASRDINIVPDTNLEPTFVNIKLWQRYVTQPPLSLIGQAFQARFDHREVLPGIVLREKQVNLAISDNGDAISTDSGKYYGVTPENPTLTRHAQTEGQVAIIRRLQETLSAALFSSTGLRSERIITLSSTFYIVSPANLEAIESGDGRYAKTP